VDREWGGSLALFCAPYKNFCVWKWHILTHIEKKITAPDTKQSVVTSWPIIGEALPVATTKIIGAHAPVPAVPP